MRLVSLNIYGGSFFEPLMAFIQKIAPETDIFCFQEVLTTDEAGLLKSGTARANIFAELAHALSDFTGFFAARQDGYNFSGYTDDAVVAGNALFVRSSYKPSDSGDFFVYRQRNSYVPNDLATLPYSLQYCAITVSGKPLTVCNFHGTSEPGDKRDSPDRLLQSERIIAFAKKHKNTVIVGDFNLFPKTRSIQLFEEAGFRNLINDFEVLTTRGSLVKQLHPEYGSGPNGWQEYADYAFTSPGVMVNHFAVPDVPISDHLPLILDFSL